LQWLGGEEEENKRSLAWLEEKGCWWHSWWCWEVRRLAGDSNGDGGTVKEKGES